MSFNFNEHIDNTTDITLPIGDIITMSLLDNAILNEYNFCIKMENDNMVIFLDDYHNDESYLHCFYNIFNGLYTNFSDILKTTQHILLPDNSCVLPGVFFSGGLMIEPYMQRVRILCPDFFDSETDKIIAFLLFLSKCHIHLGKYTICLYSELQTSTNIIPTRGKYTDRIHHFLKLLRDLYNTPGLSEDIQCPVINEYIKESLLEYVRYTPHTHISKNTTQLPTLTRKTNTISYAYRVKEYIDSLRILDI